MPDILVWPHELLRPAECRPNPVPFSRSGGRSLGGIEPTTRTDLGYWSIELNNIPITSADQRRTWTAMRQKLGGRPGLIAVPAWSFDTAPYVSGVREPIRLVPHDDDTLFNDDTPYLQNAISVVSDGLTPLGATVIRMRIIEAAADVTGVRFSFQHALYETGPAIEIDGDFWTVPIFPTVRELIPAGSTLEFDMPTCLCHLAEERGMDGGINVTGAEQRSVSFLEANDYWNSLV